MREFERGNGLWWVLVIGIAASSVAGCDDSLVTPGELPGQLLTVVLISDASNGLPIHVFTQEESFDPSNRLEPGEQRETLVSVPESRRVTFHAGRNGNVIVNTTCEFVSAAEGFVRWIDGRLECGNSLENI